MYRPRYALRAGQAQRVQRVQRVSQQGQGAQRRLMTSLVGMRRLSALLLLRGSSHDGDHLAQQLQQPGRSNLSCTPITWTPLLRLPPPHPSSAT